MNKHHAIFILIGCFALFLSGFWLGRSCAHSSHVANTIVEISTDTVYVDVASVWLDTINIVGNAPTERVNFRHEDSTILIQGYTINKPPSAYLEYYIRPIKIEVVSSGEILDVLSPPPFTVSYVGGHPAKSGWLIYGSVCYELETKRIMPAFGIGYKINHRIAITGGVYDRSISGGIIFFP